MLQQLPPPTLFTSNSWLIFVVEIIKILAPLVTLVVGFLNLSYTVWVFRYKDRKDDEVKQRDIKLSLFKSIILDYTLPSFYEFFDNIQREVEKLHDNNSTIEERDAVESAISAHQTKVRMKFVDTLNEVSPILYQQILDKIDILVGDINDARINKGINLTDRPKFEETILSPISETRTDILGKLFNFQG